MSDTTLQLLPLEKLRESPLNPRRHYDEIKLAELAASIKEKGILTPLTVRPMAASRWPDPRTPLYEIGAGHRRYRAAKIAALEHLSCFVREMDDVSFLELLVIENDQREDVHPLEQAAGYRALMLQEGYDAKRIADRIGRSEKFVYDRIKLLQLTPLAQQLFLAGKIMAGHAILLARLTPDQQKRAIEIGDDYRETSGLFQGEAGHGDLWGEDTRPSKDPLAAFEGYKPKSVRELDSWIDGHIRFDPTKADAFLFPAVAAAVGEAPKPLIPITRNHYVQEEARDGKVRTYGPASWKDAAKKPCPYAQGAVIVVGEGRGDVLQVCLSSHRDQCATHWAKEKKDAAARRRQLGRSERTGKGEDPGVAETRAKNAREREELDRKLTDETDRRFLTELLGKLKGPLPRVAWLYLAEDSLERNRYDVGNLLDGAFGKDALKKKPAGMTTDELGRLVFGLELAFRLNDGQPPASILHWAKTLKVDRLAIAKAVQAEHHAQKPAAVQTSARKPPATRKRTKR